MQAVAELAPDCGVITAACAALELSRASFHRHQVAATRPPVPVRPRTKPARALAANERQTVIACCGRNLMSTSLRLKSTPVCSTRAPTIARSVPCIGSCMNMMK